MFLVATFLGHSFSTKDTEEWLFSGVIEDMAPQGCCLSVGLPADVASVRIVRIMGHHVPIVGIPGLKLLPALTAKVGCLIGMEAHVVAIGTRIAEDLAANVAFEGRSCLRFCTLLPGFCRPFLSL